MQEMLFLFLPLPKIKAKITIPTDDKRSITGRKRRKTEFS